MNGGKQERAAYDMALENANRYKAAADCAEAEQARVGRLLAGRRSPATVKVGDWVWMDCAHVPDQNTSWRCDGTVPMMCWRFLQAGAL